MQAPPDARPVPRQEQVKDGVAGAEALGGKPGLTPRAHRSARALGTPLTTSGLCRPQPMSRGPDSDLPVAARAPEGARRRDTSIPGHSGGLVPFPQGQGETSGLCRRGGGDR